jgi:glycosyltransferase involved in cell wall biosynthesis
MSLTDQVMNSFPDVAPAISRRGPRGTTGNRTLLLVTYHFPPSGESGSYRMLGFAEHLPKAGWNVIVVAPPSTPLGAIDERLAERIPAATKAFRVAYPQGIAGKLGFRLFRHKVWVPRAKAACRLAIETHRPDVVLTSGPPHCVHAIGRYAKRTWGLPWVADFRDPWISGKEPHHQKKAGWGDIRAEQKAFCSADLIVANSPNAARALAAAQPAIAEKVQFITNGYDPDRFQQAIDRTESETPLQLVHTGEIYTGRDPRPLLDAVQQMNKSASSVNARAAITFVGRADADKCDLAAEVNHRGLDDVVALTGQVPYGEALRHMRRADILVLLDQPGRTIGIPAKLFEYIGTGNPILAFAEPNSDTAWALALAKVPHRIVCCHDQLAIASAIRDLATVRRMAKEKDENTKSTCFTRASMAARLAELMDGILP